MAQVKLVRVQEKGQVTIPVEIRKQLGLKKGDLVAVEPTPQGALISPREAIAIEALDRMSEILNEQGLTLDELIESGRELRAEIIREHYPDLDFSFEDE